jgi:hypothetical protein
MTREEFKQGFLRRVKDALHGLFDHFWISLADFGLPDRWVTGEVSDACKEVDFGPVAYMCCYVTDRIDSLGYCYGRILLDAYPDQNDDDDEILSYADYFFDYVDDADFRERCERASDQISHSECKIRR